MVGELTKIFLKGKKLGGKENKHSGKIKEGEEDWHEDDSDDEFQDADFDDEDYGFSDDEFTDEKKKYLDNLKAKKDGERRKVQTHKNERGDTISEVLPHGQGEEEEDEEMEGEEEYDDEEGSEEEFKPNRKAVGGEAVERKASLSELKDSKQKELSKSVLVKKESGLMENKENKEKEESQHQPGNKTPTVKSKDGSKNQNHLDPSNLELDNRSRSGGSNSSVSKRSPSVLDVKKRDKTNMLDNLTRIHLQRQEDGQEIYEEDESNDEGHGKDFKKRINDLRSGKKKKREFRVPGSRMEDRIKARKGETKGLDKWGLNCVPLPRKRIKPKRLYRFKNHLTDEEKVNLGGVNLEMLHTDELMAYYRELILKGNRDSTAHHREQNTLKRLEYNQVQLPSEGEGRSKSRSKSKSPSRDKSKSRMKNVPKITLMKANGSSVEINRPANETRGQREEKKTVTVQKTSSSPAREKSNVPVKKKRMMF